MLNDIQLSDTQPGDWVLVGQGRANAVFAYRGSRADLANKVLRLSKPRTAPRPEHAVTLEQKVWKGHLDVSEPDPVLRAFSYVHEVILPQIGRKYIPQQALTEVPAKLAQALLLQISSQTEKARSCPATVLPNNTLFSQQQQGAATVCVELKPKWGLLPKSVAIHPDNGIKRSTSRFQMQQLLKRAQGKTEVVSKYDPLELFSGEDRRVRHAIAALADNPQNNLRIFRDSQPRPFSGLWTSEGRKQLAAALEGWEQPPAKLHDVLIAALQLILMREDVLGDLLRLQRLDEHDIEGVHHLYSCLVDRQQQQSEQPQEQQPVSNSTPQQPAVANGRSHSSPRSPPHRRADSVTGSPHVHGDCSHRRCAAAARIAELAACEEARMALQELPTELAYAVLRGYMVAATAKDCSIMIAIRQVDAGSSGSSSNGAAGSGGSHPEACPAARGDAQGVVSVGSARFVYKIAIADLDFKPLEKIEEHFSLDRDIVQQAKRRRLSTP